MSILKNKTFNLTEICKVSRFYTLDSYDVQGKTVLVRGDLNVPIKNRQILDETRIKYLLPTLKELTKKGARAVILSHFGRPAKAEAKFSLRQVLPALEKLLKVKVTFLSLDDQTKTKILKTGLGSITLLENVRFYAGEKENDPRFVKSLARLGDIYVNDALSCAHRAHASTCGIAYVLPSAIGRGMQEELEELGKAFENPRHPFAALIGGAKVSTKLGVLEKLVTKVDTLILGGGMANTFLMAQGKNVGDSLCERGMLDQASKIITKAQERDCNLVLPSDVVVAKSLTDRTTIQEISVDEVPRSYKILDIGTQTIEKVVSLLQNHRTILWNGPFGAFESSPFDKGTLLLAQRIAALTVESQASKGGGIKSIAGGGDTVAALAKAGVEEKFSYVLTAGGAFLEWLEDKELPGLVCLYKNPKQSAEVLKIKTDDTVPHR